MSSVSDWAECIRQHHDQRLPLSIEGHGSKRDCHRGTSASTTLSMNALEGIVDYEPSELYIQVRAATPLADVRAALAQQGQMLPFDPPCYGGRGTWGGAIAAGLSGPGRARYGALRDYMLGVTLVNGSGVRLRFGGKVIKNVAGYDVSRLCAGSWGTLGVIEEATVKVLPLPSSSVTRVLDMSAARAVIFINEQLRQGMPISATFYDGQQLHVRLSSSADDLLWAEKIIGGEVGEASLWAQLRDHQHPFFSLSESELTLWRLSLPITADCRLSGASVFEWNGALHWLKSDLPAATIRDEVFRLGGQAWLFRTTKPAIAESIFSPLPPALMTIHRRLKHAFDPAGILNPGIMYSDF